MLEITLCEFVLLSAHQQPHIVAGQADGVSVATTGHGTAVTEKPGRLKQIVRGMSKIKRCDLQCMLKKKT